MEREGSPWLAELLKRQPRKLGAVALANKMCSYRLELMITGGNYTTKAALPAEAAAA